MILTVTIHPALDKILRLPRLRPNDTARARIEMQYGGGKGNNVARALTRLGVPVVATGYQGGPTGEMLIRQFSEEGVRTDFYRCAAPTRTSLMLIEEETGKTYAVYEPGQSVTAGELDGMRNHFARLLPSANSAVFCGSGQTPELARLHYELIQMAEQKGVRCSLDSSGGALAEGVRAKPHLLKVNREELSDLVGRELLDLSSQMQAMRELHASGIHWVALTRGAEGVLLTDGKRLLEGLLRMDRVVNVMGCGDSTLAGMIAAMEDGQGIEAVVRRGVAAGAANTQVIGAGYIDAPLVRELEPRVAVRELKF